ncbi:unnamed protein product [Echinostoma caproni]|uniref:Uncharacterized protein n=1 Tax=Echinostoma caproni TaxID=27848 RepID=A0A183ABK7_9TREM|nr:unnamed protein product [Echinostoma caproni]
MSQWFARLSLQTSHSITLQPQDLRMDACACAGLFQGVYMSDVELIDLIVVYLNGILSSTFPSSEPPSSSPPQLPKQQQNSNVNDKTTTKQEQQQ